MKSQVDLELHRVQVDQVGLSHQKVQKYCHWGSRVSITRASRGPIGPWGPPPRGPPPRGPRGSGGPGGLCQGNHHLGNLRSHYQENQLGHHQENKVVHH